MMFDKFYPVRQKVPKQVGEFDVIRFRKPKIFNEEWVDAFDLEDYVLWGLPKPKMVHNLDMIEVISLMHPKNSEYESGIILKKGFSTKEALEIEITLESEADFDGIKFGLTEGSGIKSSVNGRTGKSLFDISPNTEVQY